MIQHSVPAINENETGKRSKEIPDFGNESFQESFCLFIIEF